MKPIRSCILAALLSFVTAPCIRALELLPADWPVSASLHGTLDLEMFAADRPTPGLLIENDTVFFAPCLTLFGDIHAGKHLAAFLQARFDRGFDPGAELDGAARLDEYFLRWSPLDGPGLNIQAGKFATVFGAWVPRHLSWDNPLVTAPAPYGNIFGMTDHGAPASTQAFLNRRKVADKKNEWLPVVWGPCYASGASVFGRIEKFDYAFQVTNTGLSSRPGTWAADQTGFGDPTWTGRLGYRPNAAWNLGVSGSLGSYIVSDPRNQLPKGTGRGDYQQRTLGFDAAYAHHYLELWGEVILSQFEVPHAGNAGTLAYFIEAKFKVTESLFTALRWNQQFFSRVEDGLGNNIVWDRGLSRVDVGLGWRFNRWLQAKVQYSFGQESGPNHNGANLLATMLTVRF